MRVAITATDADLETKVEPRFGRCPYFLLVETDDLSFEALENPNVTAGEDAGIQSARLVMDQGVKVVLTGTCELRAERALRANGVKVIIGCIGTAQEAIERFRAGGLGAAAGVPGLLLDV